MNLFNKSGKMVKKRRRRPPGFFIKMTDRDLVDYTFKLYGSNIYLNEMLKRDNTLYNHLRRRKLTRNFNMMKRWHGFFKEMSDEKILRETFTHYGTEVTRQELINKDGSWYQELLKRGLLEKIKT